MTKTTIVDRVPREEKEKLKRLFPEVESSMRWKIAANTGLCGDFNKLPQKMKELAKKKLGRTY